VRLVQLVATATLVVLVAGATPTRSAEPSPLDLFNSRILPIFRSPKPASCIQCHLASVDLKNYILPSHEKTFASLRDQGLVDLDSPEKSRILGLIRMGEKDLDKGARLIHAKMRNAEYKSFVTWIADYSRVVGNRYASVENLPADNWYASRSILRLMATPAGWKVGQPVQMFVHAFDQQSGRFGSEPIAFTQGTVTPKHIVNGALFLLAPRDGRDAITWDRERARLPQGRYLVRVFVDSKRRLANDASLLLGAEDYVGQAEIVRARWREGFRHAEMVRGMSLSRD
jgi:hypothetical protein